MLRAENRAALKNWEEPGDEARETTRGALAMDFDSSSSDGSTSDGSTVSPEDIKVRAMIIVH